jgi:tRNA threonylcarbamoyladenosine biosynthesis protein TsaE
MKFISKDSEDTKKIAEKLVRSLEVGERAVVLALYGDLGAGKTTLAQNIGEYLGVHDPIQSPTYLIEKIYELRRSPWQHLVHIDAYRLDDESELLSLGWREIVNKPENLIIVEWADKVGNILPDDAIHIHIRHVSEHEREIEISQRDEEAPGTA